MEDSRSARRKRLVSQGGDRLAFITGQSRSFRKDDYLTPPSPVAGAPNPEEVAASSVPATSAQPEIRAGDQIANSEVAKDDRKETLPKETTAEILPKKEANSEPTKSEARNEISKSATNNESLKREEPDFNAKAEPSATAVAAAAPPPPRAVAPKQKFASFTPGQISFAISASEDVRLLCAVVVALSVVFSYRVHSLGVGSIVSFRPMLLVLLTDATVVFARLMASRGSGGGRGEEEARAAAAAREGDDWDVGKILETLMVLQRASSAAFMDCSICAVIIICGGLVAF